METSWIPKVVENISSSELKQKTKIQNFSNHMSYASAIALVEEKRKVNSAYLFTDEDFPPDQSSLTYTNKGKPKDIVWKRTYELSNKPSFMTKGYSRNDVIQGQMSNCYFLTSLAAIAERPKSIRVAVPKNQPTAPDPNYSGVFHIRLWQFGTWYDVVVDDWMPSMKNKDGSFRLAFGHSSDPNEFWIALAEKAYAKLHGSYEAIDNGLTMEAFEDLTGGISVRCELEKGRDENLLLRRIRRAVRSGNFVSLATTGRGAWDKERGLQGSHAYSVTLAEKIKVEGKKVHLFRVRNPWARKDYEWKLDWSDTSEKWKLLTKEQKKTLKYPAGDGEWYMSFEDILKYMSYVTICTGGPDFDEDGVTTNEEYFYSFVQGQWVRGINAGGPFQNNPLQKFLRNPQYLIRVPDAGSKPVSVFISFMQRYTRPQNEGRFKYKIGHRFYEVGPSLAKGLLETGQKVDFRNHHHLELVEARDDCIYQRGISLALDLERDKNYLYLPFTGAEGQEEDFLIRVYSEERISLVELR